MSNSIQIPTYKTLIPNSTYSRRAGSICFQTIEDEIQATKILQLVRYTAPSEDEVVNLIQSVARNGHTSSSPEKLQLEEFLKMLPLDKIEGIQYGLKETLTHLKGHCPKGDYQIGKTYLQVDNGTIPNQILEHASDVIKEKGEMAYRGVVAHLGIEQWDIRIRLDGKDSLPKSLELEYLLDRGVKDCDVFKIKGDYGNYQNAVNQIRLLSNVLNSPADVRKIADKSDMFLISKAAITLKDTAKCLFAGNAIKSFTEGLKEAIESLQNGEEMYQGDDDNEDDKGESGFHGRDDFFRNN